MSDHLYELLCRKQTLFIAWQRVKEKNTAGGIDRRTVEEYAKAADKNIDDLLDQLKSGKYIQQPYHEVFIPKNETEKRRLGLLTVHDKIVQTAVGYLVTPIFEKGFLNVSYGYRSKKGPVKAIHKVQHLIANEHYTWLASCDIDNFFDTIPHDILFKRLVAYLKSPGIVELMKMFVRMGRVNRSYQWKNTGKGVPQGGVVSPLLANFYLHPLDKLMVEKGYGFVRYADDFIILGKTEAIAQQALQEAIDIITNQLKLSLNEGTEVIPVENGFEFLGIYFKGQQLSLSERKYKRLVSKLYDSAKTGEGFITHKLGETMQGIRNFYGKLVPQETLGMLDDELVSILRNKIDSLKPGKEKHYALMREVQKLDFFCSKHNFQRSEYVQERLSGNSHHHTTVKNTGKVIIAPVKSEKAVKKRKHEYQKLEAAGFSLVLSKPGLWVGKRDNAIVVKKDKTIIQEVALINLKNVTVMSEGVVFSSNVIEACAANKVAINFLKSDGLPYATLYQPSLFEAETGLAQLEAYRNGKCFNLIKQIIWGKINNQANLLKYYSKYYLKHNKDFGQAYAPAIDAIECRASEALSLEHPVLDEFRLKMFAIEGQASARYWDTIGLLINAHIPFNGRERKGATDLVNCMLNYGYGILYSRVTQAIIRAKLNPALSYLHKPENNRPSLIFDFIEEFRQQAVDRAVFAVIMKNKNLNATDGKLDEHTKKLVVEKVIERLNTVEVFRGHEMRLFEIIHSQAENLVLYLEGKSKIYRPYIRKW